MRTDPLAALKLLGVLLVSMHTSVASADVVKYFVSGTIDVNQDAGLYPTIVEGDAFSGFFAFDDSIAGVKSASSFGNVYSFDHPPGFLGVSVTVDGVTYQGKTSGSDYSPQLFDDSFGSDSLVHFQEAVPLSGHEESTFRVQAEFVGPTSIFSIGEGDTVHLPSTMNLGDWTTKREIKFGVSASTGAVTQFFRGEIDVMEMMSGGDYNMDGSVDEADADLLSAATKDPSPDLMLYDENDDGMVDYGDRIIWIHDYAQTWVGDSNLDQEFGSGDLVSVFAAGKYETGQMANWAQGDWDGNMMFDSSDLVAAFADGGYEQGPRTPMLVPEPSAMTLLLVAVAPFFSRSYRRRNALNPRIHGVKLR